MWSKPRIAVTFATSPEQNVVLHSLCKMGVFKSQWVEKFLKFPCRWQCLSSDSAIPIACLPCYLIHGSPVANIEEILLVLCHRFRYGSLQLLWGLGDVLAL